MYHFPNFVIPPLRAGRAVCSIHDLGFLRFPNFTEDKNLRYLRTRMTHTVERADAIITISKFSASEIAHFYPDAAAKVHVTYPGVDDFINAHPPPAEAEERDPRRRLKLDRPYILTVGTVEPRKNMSLLIDAFDRMNDFDGDLAIAGMPGWKNDAIFRKMKQARRADRIRYLRYVPDAELAGLYRGAELFAFPSVYEGFGFPPLEAMGCGTPVVSSSAAAMPEVIGPAADIVDSFDPDEWAHRMFALITDADLRQRRIAAGRERIKAFTWQNAARETLNIYHTLDSHS